MERSPGAPEVTVSSTTALPSVSTPGFRGTSRITLDGLVERGFRIGQLAAIRLSMSRMLASRALIAATRAAESLTSLVRISRQIALIETTAEAIPRACPYCVALRISAELWRRAVAGGKSGSARGGNLGGRRRRGCLKGAPRPLQGIFEFGYRTHPRRPRTAFESCRGAPDTPAFSASVRWLKPSSMRRRATKSRSRINDGSRESAVAGTVSPSTSSAPPVMPQSEPHTGSMDT